MRRWKLPAPANKVVEILSASITDASNTTNAQLAAAFQQVTTLGTPASTSVTPTKGEQGDQASGSTVTAPAPGTTRRAVSSSDLRSTGSGPGTAPPFPHADSDHAEV